jgi:GntR family transcriptional repressor for pyruvate dehydrogenase complex
MFEQVQSQKFYLQIVSQIRDLIAEGRLGKGDKLPPERTLAQQFGASRAVIREALSALEVLGIIECRRGQGDFIKVDATEASINSELMRELLQEHSPREIFEARVELEPSLAGLAAENATEKDIYRLERQLKKLNALGREAELDPEKIDDYMEEDRKFHLEVARAAHNSVLFDVSASVNLMMKESRWKALKRKNIEKEGNIKQFEVEHTEIFEAIRDRKSDVARAIIREHIEEIAKDLFD